MLKLQYTARQVGGPEEYLPLDQFPLRVESAVQGGDGSADCPFVQEIIITAAAPFEGVIRIALPVEGADPRFFLPGFMYGTNRADAPLDTSSKTPRLKAEGDFPTSSWWMVRSDRLSHPCAFVYADGRLQGLAASPYYVHSDSRRFWEPGVTGDFDQYAGFGCALPGEICYTLGYENAPWFFLDSRHYTPRKELGENCIRLQPGETLNVRLYLFDLPAQDERALHGPLAWVYGRYHESPRQVCSLKQTVADITGAIMRDAWLTERKTYSGFVFDREDHFEYRPLPSISWTNGLAAATPMLVSAHRLGNEAMRAQSIEAIDHIVENSLNPRSGLPYMAETDAGWSNRGWWFEQLPVPGHAAYLVGQFVYLLLKAYAWEEKSGVTHESWLTFAKNIVARTEKARNSDGEYPYVLSEKTGAGIAYDSLSGSWCMAAAAYLAYLTGDKQYLPDLLRSESYYHKAFVCPQECYGGPLDIDKSIDSEGVLAYIRAVRYLHALTGDEALLDHLRDALHYEFTFKFCYNSPIKTPPLSTVGWSSCGGSITSVTNPHIHPMSSSVMDEMSYYLARREDAYIRSRLDDTRLWSCQCHALHDGEYGYGKKGWMSERFCHSEGLVKERFPDGTPASTWFALMPWACGSLLEGLTGDAWDDL